MCWPCPVVCRDYATDSFGSLGLDFLGNPPQDTVIQQENETWAVFGQGSYDVTDNLTLTAGARYAEGFRAQTIQGRDVAFLETPTVARPETIESIEVSYEFGD